MRKLILVLCAAVLVGCSASHSSRSNPAEECMDRCHSEYGVSFWGGILGTVAAMGAGHGAGYQGSGAQAQLKSQQAQYSACIRSCSR